MARYFVHVDVMPLQKVPATQMSETPSHSSPSCRLMPAALAPTVAAEQRAHQVALAEAGLAELVFAGQAEQAAGALVSAGEVSLDEREVARITEAYRAALVTSPPPLAEGRALPPLRRGRRRANVTSLPQLIWRSHAASRMFGFCLSALNLADFRSVARR